MKEATITICGVTLSEGQSLAVRVAIGNMQLLLEDQDYRNNLGPIAAGYDARLGEVQALIMQEAR